MCGSFGTLEINIGRETLAYILFKIVLIRSERKYMNISIQIFDTKNPVSIDEEKDFNVIPL